MTYKKKIIVVENEKQEKILKKALGWEKTIREVGIKTAPPKIKEDRITEINEIEKLEKQIN